MTRYLKYAENDSSGGASEGCCMAACLHVAHCQTSPPIVPENELSKCLFRLERDHVAHISVSNLNPFEHIFGGVNVADRILKKSFSYVYIK